MKQGWIPTALATALALAACGGNSDADFRDRAQAVCTTYAKQIEAIGTPSDITQLADTSGKTADLLEKQIAELEALEAPGSLAGDFAQWMKLNGEALTNARAIQAAAGEQDQQRITELAGDAGRNTLSADRLARDLELPGCMIEPPEES